MSFKLLAIRPMPGTDSKFLKNLKPGVIYKFYQEYQFLDKDGNDLSDFEYFQKTGDGLDEKHFLKDKNVSPFPAETKVIKVKPYDNPSVPENLYSQDGGPSINISAVVGKNGSGKSALIEFYVRSIYLISKNLKILDFDEECKKLHQILSDYKHKSINSIKAFELDIKNDRPEIATDYKTLKSYFHYLDYFQNTIRQIGLLKTENVIFDNFDQRFNVQIFLHSKKGVETIDVEDNRVFINGEVCESEVGFRDIINHYNILTNYSIYGLNPNELGSWINVLFHKNDGYETPLVINPMKTNGFIDVNNDLRLNRIRNINRFLDSGYILGKKIDKIILDFYLKPNDLSIKIVEKSEKEYQVLYNNEIINDSFYKINDIMGVDLELNKIGISFDTNLEKKYLNKSLEIITNLLDKTYEESERIILSNEFERNLANLFHYFLDKLYRFKVNYLNDFGYIDNLIEFVKKYIVNDESHSTYKLRQCLYYFRTNIFEKLLPETIKGKAHFTKLEIDISDFNTRLVEKNEFRVPITYFNIDFKFEDGSKYSELSSGQIQLLNSLATSYYHIKNIDSKYNDNSKNIESINLIFDEVELYFHPDFQRVYVNEVIHLLKNSKFKYVNTFNVLFLTHSPFILSDIPSQNILRLKDGKPVKAKNDTNSFAANIHDLLADEFFLEDGFMGEFAKGKINEIIQYLTYKLNEKEIKNLKEKIVELKKDGKNVSLQTKKRTFLNAENKSIKEKIKIEKIKKEDIRSFIDLIGEPLIRLKLEQMLKLI